MVELLTVIAIIAILAVILIPVVARIQNSAKDNKCASNLRQIGMLAQLYETDHHGEIPYCKNYQTNTHWFEALAKYAGNDQGGLNYNQNREIFYSCPHYELGKDSEDFEVWNPGYGLNREPGLPDEKDRNWAGAPGSNQRIFRMSEITDPAQRVYFGDSQDYHMAAANVDTDRHGDHANFVFFDGHVEPLTAEQIESAFSPY